MLGALITKGWNGLSKTKNLPEMVSSKYNICQTKSVYSIAKCSSIYLYLVPKHIVHISLFYKLYLHRTHINCHHYLTTNSKKRELHYLMCISSIYYVRCVQPQMSLWHQSENAVFLWSLPILSALWHFLFVGYIW